MTNTNTLSANAIANINTFKNTFDNTFAGFYTNIVRPTLSNLATEDADINHLLIAFMECCSNAADYNERTMRAADAAGDNIHDRLRAIQYALAEAKAELSMEFGLSVDQTLAIFDLAECIIERSIEAESAAEAAAEARAKAATEAAAEDQDDDDQDECDEDDRPLSGFYIHLNSTVYNSAYGILGITNTTLSL